MRRITLALLIATGLVSTVKAQAPAPPSLVVVLVVDQLRADYLTRFRHQWSQGLARLMDEGAWFRQAAYPYFATVTCAGHATIVTGTLPPTHGQLMNEWYDRDRAALVNCTDDERARTLSYGEPRTGGHSARKLRVPTIADEMRIQLPVPPKIVSLSLKVRSAVMLAGHEADSVTWFEGRSLATSSAYGDGLSPFVERFLANRPIEREFGTVWDRVQPESAYLYPASTPESDSEAGWDHEFPHTLGGEAITPDRWFYRGWSRSPFSDRYLADLAAAAVDEYELGQASRTDYLAISFSALDRVGHDYGSRSHEVQDTLMRLDQTLGALMAHLDEAVGRDRYVLALSADHGVSPIPEQLAGMGFDAGRLDVKLVRSRVDEALRPHLGPGPHVARINHTELYFEPGVYERLDREPLALRAAIEAIEAVPGVQTVYRAEDVPGLRDSSRPVERAIALSHVPDRSGDLTVIPKIYWTTSGNAAGHGTGYDYDKRVPILFHGAGIRPGQYDAAASPADIAPTLAFLTGVTLARPDGRVLSEALGETDVTPPTVSGPADDATQR